MKIAQYFLKRNKMTRLSVSSQKKIRPKIYLIDFENVHSAGLKGCEKTKRYDRILLFYTQDDRLDFDAAFLIRKSKACFEFCKVEKPAPAIPNYLDFQLVARLSCLVGRYKNKKDYIIVSNDNGYQSVIDFWKRNNIEISRQSKIQTAANAENRDGEKFIQYNVQDIQKDIQQKLYHVLQKMSISKIQKQALYNAVISSASIKEYQNKASTILDPVQLALIIPKTQNLVGEYNHKMSNALNIR